MTAMQPAYQQYGLETNLEKMPPSSKGHPTKSENRQTPATTASATRADKRTERSYLFLASPNKSIKGMRRMHVLGHCRATVLI